MAAKLDKQAIAILTVSDHLLDHSKDMDAKERETKFQTTLELALAAAYEFKLYIRTIPVHSSF